MSRCGHFDGEAGPHTPVIKPTKTNKHLANQETPTLKEWEWLQLTDGHTQLYDEDESSTGKPAGSHCCKKYEENLV